MILLLKLIGGKEEKRNQVKTWRHWVLSWVCFFSFVPFISSAQTVDSLLLQSYEKQFLFLDSLIYLQQCPTFHVERDAFDERIQSSGHNQVDSLLNDKVQQQVRALKAETGLMISGNTYYRLDEGFSIDDEDALSRYNAKVQVELRWNLFSSSFINRKSRIHELELKGELEKNRLEQERIGKLIDRQKRFFQEEYDSLLAGVLQLRIHNLQLLNDAQRYLASDRSIRTDELLEVMDDLAISERQLAVIPKNYPAAAQLVRPTGAYIRVDTMRLMQYIEQNDLQIHEKELQLRLLEEQEKKTNYWRTLNLSPFFRYSYYVTPTSTKNFSNVDAGVAFQIPLSLEESRKRKAIKAERLQRVMEKDCLKELIAENVRMLLLDIERANRGMAGEVKRIERMRDYLNLRKHNYQSHIGAYNYLSRIKEYNHYLSCWENYYSYQYKRDICLTELQAFLKDKSILDFCIILN